MLDQCQTFKAAFLHRCLQHGLSLEQTHALVKEACASLEAGEGIKTATGPWPWLKDNIPGVSLLADAASGAAKSVGSAVPGLALGAYLGIPIVAGGAAGYGLAQIEGLNDEDPQEIKTQEKIEAYRRATQRAELQRKLRMGREQRRPSRPLL